MTSPWIGHRGAGKLAPENTLPAFALGLAHGFTAFECDVRLSADGVPFLLHDDRLERTTSGHGPAGALAWSELSRLDAGGGAPLPTLAALIAWAQRHAAWLNLELKPNPGDAVRTGRVVAQAAQAARLTADHLLLSSFDPAALAAAREAAPELPRALLIDGQATSDWPDVAQALGCTAIVAHHPLITEPAWVAAQQARGWQVLTYTVNDAARACELLRWGVTGIITDALDQVGPCAQRRLNAGQIPAC